ncbi:MAG: hypothetical protein ACREI3_03790 [Nitrospirales bacterium]
MAKTTPPHQPDPPEEKPKASTSGQVPPGDDKPRKEIPLVSVPNDADQIADEMAELFEEDQVTHKHGNTEPEGD